MENYIIEGIHQDEGRAFIDAMSTITRFDEAIKSDKERSSLYLPGARRREAIAIAMAEGAMPLPINLCRLIGDKETTNVDRGTRIAAAIYETLVFIGKHSQFGTDDHQIIELFNIADSPTGRLMSQELKWTVHEDALWLTDVLEGYYETPDPWTSFETLRTIWKSGRFLGTSRRIALLLAHHIIPIGIGCEQSMYGIVDVMRRDYEDLKHATNDPFGWNIMIANSISFGIRDEYKKLKNIGAERLSMLSLCPPVRNSSSIESAIAFLFEHPVFSAKLFSEKLGLTARGAKVVLDRLLDSSVIEVDGGIRNRKYTCRRII